MNIVLEHFYKPLEEILSLEDIIELNTSTVGQVFLELPQKGRMVRDYPFLDKGYWVRLCTVLANLKRIDFHPHRLPRLSTQLPGGHRLQAQFGEIIGLESGFCISIRVKRNPVLTLKDFGITGEFAEELLSLIRGRANILISGGTSSGKTTFMNLLIQEIPLHTRILYMEDTQELIVPHKNASSYVVSRNGENAVKGYRDLIDHILRSSPDIVLSGEVSIANSFPIMRLLNTGHGGFMTTIHADTPLKALKNTFAQNIQLAELNIDNPLSFLKSQIDLVIQLSKMGQDNRGIVEAYYPKQERHLYFKEGHIVEEKRGLKLKTENRFERVQDIVTQMQRMNISIEEVAQVNQMEKLKNEAERAVSWKL